VAAFANRKRKPFSSATGVIRRYFAAHVVARITISTSGRQLFMSPVTSVVRNKMRTIAREKRRVTPALFLRQMSVAARFRLELVRVIERYWVI